MSAVEYIHVLHQAASNKIKEGVDLQENTLRTQLLEIIISQGILNEIVPNLEDSGWRMDSNLMDVVSNTGNTEVLGIGLIFKRLEEMHTDYWNGQLFWIGVSKSDEFVCLTVRHGAAPKLVLFDKTRGIDEEQRNLFKSDIEAAVKNPGRYFWCEGMSNESLYFV